MTDDPLAGLRAWIQETETRLNDLEVASRYHQAALLRLCPTPENVKRAARESLGRELEDVERSLKVEEHMDLVPNCACESCQDQVTGTTEARLSELERCARTGDRLGGILRDPAEKRESDLLAQIQRMANTTAALQRELAKVAMERDEARARTGQWNVNLSLLAENEGLKRELEAERAEKTKCKEDYEADV
jgi:hypothetical protein